MTNEREELRAAREQCAWLEKNGTEEAAAAARAFLEALERSIAESPIEPPKLGLVK